MRWRIQTLLLATVILLTAVLLSACGARGAAHSLKMAPLAQLPAALHQHPAPVQEAYQFALANPEVLTHIPCYCGCGAIHANVRACFVGEAPDGSIQWDAHGSACGVCQDIVHDTMRMMRAGQPLPAIRDYIDETYDYLGPPTNTPPLTS